MSNIPYCGRPPVPGGVTWNLDPLLISMLALVGLALLGWARRARTPRGGALTLGWALAAFALVSPLCNLSVALFTARVGQHMLLTLVAAPLLAWGAVAPGRVRAAGLVPATLAFALALWAWHLPGPYEATFRSDAAYWAMHLSLGGAALWLWVALRGAAQERPDMALLATLVTAIQMTLLGALLTLAPRPLFADVHAPQVTLPWGLSPLEDQVLGGLVMWVVGGLLFTLVCLAGLAMALRPAPAR